MFDFVLKCEHKKKETKNYKLKTLLVAAKGKRRDNWSDVGQRLQSFIYLRCISYRYLNEQQDEDS